MDIIEKLRSAVDFGKRNSHIGQGEWEVMTRNGVGLCVFPLSPTARDYTKSAGYFCENGIFRIRSLIGTSGFRGNCGCKESSRCRQRRKSRTNILEKDMAHLEDMFASYLTREVNMFSGTGIGGIGRKC